MQAMFNYFYRMTWGYQLSMETKLFSTLGEQYRATLVRFVKAQREVILETCDPAQMEAALLMLIAAREDELRGSKPLSSEAKEWDL